MFTPSLNIGGVERVLLTYAEQLSDRGYDVTYLLCHDNGELSSESCVNMHNLNTKRLSLSLWKMMVFLWRHKPDYMIVANSVTLFALVAKWLSFCAVKIIASHHYFPNVETISWIDRWLVFRLYNLCYKVIAISQGVYALLRTNKVHEEKIQLIYNPINILEINNKSLQDIEIPSTEYILFVGRLAKVKNIRMLIEAIHFLREKKEIPLVIVGDGPEREVLDAYIKSIGATNVYMVGATSNPYPYIRHARVVVLSSSSEAFPTVLLESLVLGRTIVSTPTIGAKEILDSGKYGYICKTFGDVNEFANTLLYAYNNPLCSISLQQYIQNTYSASISLDMLEQLL